MRRIIYTLILILTSAFVLSSQVSITPDYSNAKRLYGVSLDTTGMNLTNPTYIRYNPDSSDFETVPLDSLVDGETIDVSSGLLTKYYGTGDLDSNDNIQTSDRNAVRDYLLGDADLTDDQKILADVNGNGRVDWGDFGVINLGLGATKATFATLLDSLNNRVGAVYGEVNDSTLYIDNMTIGTHSTLFSPLFVNGNQYTVGYVIVGESLAKLIGGSYGVLAMVSDTLCAIVGTDTTRLAPQR